MLGFRVPTTCGKKTLITTYSGEVSPPPANRTTTQCETGGKTGSETESETGQDEFMLGFRVPTTCGKKTLITTYSGEVSPPPANRTTTQCETGGKTGSETGGKTGSETGGETGSKTGGETGGKTGFVQ